MTGYLHGLECFSRLHMTFIQECAAPFTLPRVNLGCRWVQRVGGWGGVWREVGVALKPTFKPKIKVQEGVHLMLRADLCQRKRDVIPRKRRSSRGAGRENVQANYHNLNVNVILNVKCR